MPSKRAGIDRARIVDHLRQHPGLRPSDVARVFSIHPSTAEYHLRRLTEEGRVARVPAGRELHHYPTGTGFCKAAREVHARLTPAAERVLEVALERSVFPRKTVVEEGLSSSAVRWAIDRMDEAGAIERLAWGVYRLVPGRAGCIRAALETSRCASCNESRAARRQTRRVTSSPSPSGRIEASRSG